MTEFFMCPPRYFEIEYAINIWTDIRSRVDRELALAQWERLREMYTGLGVEVSIVPPVEGAIELTFLGDSIFLFENQAVSGRFRHPQRSKAVPVSAAYFAGLGFEVHTLPSGVRYEGNGDSMVWNGVMLAGHGVRSDREAYDFIGPLFNLEIVPLQLLPPFYHLDLALCPVNRETLAYYPGAFSPESRQVIEKLAKNCIQIGHDEVMNFALNAKAIGDLVILNGRPCSRFESRLRQLGMQVKRVDTSEFNKAGGAAKCITLEHYRL